jgi:hypothetical protein
MRGLCGSSTDEFIDDLLSLNLLMENDWVLYRFCIIIFKDECKGRIERLTANYLQSTTQLLSKVRTYDQTRKLLRIERNTNMEIVLET